MAKKASKKKAAKKTKAKAKPAPKKTTKKSPKRRQASGLAIASQHICGEEMRPAPLPRLCGEFCGDFCSTRRNAVDLLIP